MKTKYGRNLVRSKDFYGKFLTLKMLLVILNSFFIIKSDSKSTWRTTGPVKQMQMKICTDF